jgi:hypothetical protein
MCGSDANLRRCMRGHFSLHLEGCPLGCEFCRSYDFFFGIPSTQMFDSSKYNNRGVAGTAFGWYWVRARSVCACHTAGSCDPDCNRCLPCPREVGRCYCTGPRRHQHKSGHKEAPVCTLQEPCTSSFLYVCKIPTTAFPCIPPPSPQPPPPAPPSPPSPPAADTCELSRAAATTFLSAEPC